MLTKDQIRNANDRPREFVPVIEWCPPDEEFDPAKHGVYVGTMSAKDRDDFENHLMAANPGNPNRHTENMRATLVVFTAQNEDGTRMFELNDAEWLGAKAAGPMGELFAVAVKLNPVRTEDSEELAKPQS